MTRASLPRIAKLMSHERDIAGLHPAMSRYLVCSSPRVGSNFLCALLRQTGAAGDPLEYINPRYMKAARHSGNLTDYLDGIESRRTSANGVFGLKAHHSHLVAACGSEAAQISAILARFDKFILIERRDKLAQAISLYKAQTTGFWTAEDQQAGAETGAAPQPVVFSPVKIAHALHSAIAQAQGWRRLLAAHKKLFFSVYYEDLTTNATAVAVQACNHLGIAADLVSANAAPPLRQADGESNELYNKFLRYCGMAASMAHSRNQN